MSEIQAQHALIEKMQTPDMMLDIYKHVKYVYPWGIPGTPLAKHKGPRPWHEEELKKLSEHNYNNNNLIQAGRLPLVYKLAVSSGRGPGKSAFLSWVAQHNLSTHIGSTTVITANTEGQLMSRTWPELGKWHSMAIYNRGDSPWFQRTATTIRPSKWFADSLQKEGVDTQYFYCQAQLWSEENPDAFAGLHNENGMVVLFDEASNIPAPIWTVSEGFFTEPILWRYWMAFGNPRRNKGEFYECFHKNKDAWRTRNIDSRTIKELDQTVFNDLVKRYGEDSDIVRVEVRGEFPRKGSNQLISVVDVEDACKRHIKKGDYKAAPKILGIDVAREGDDESVFQKRQGLFAFEPRGVKIPNNMTIADIGANIITTWGADACMVDRGAGAGVIDRLRQLGFDVIAVDSGGSARDLNRYLNKRIEMWDAMAEWIIQGGVIPDHKRLKEDLSNPLFTFTPITNKKLLESVKDMKGPGRNLPSPDYGTALALTFAYPVSPAGLANAGVANVVKNYDPFKIPSEKSQEIEYEQVGGFYLPIMKK